MRITIALPNTHFERPTAEELRKLRKIVTAAHPWLNDCDEQSFSRAFTAIGFMFRTPQPVKSRYFHDILADANQLLDELLDLRLVDGIAFLAAALGHGDVKWQESNGRVGALLEIGLCPTHGIPCSNSERMERSARRNAELARAGRAVAAASARAEPGSLSAKRPLAMTNTRAGLTPFTRRGNSGARLPRAVAGRRPVHVGRPFPSEATFARTIGPDRGAARRPPCIAHAL